EIASAGTKRRTRAQCALTHFDEAGVIVLLRDPALLALWDAHDWLGLFHDARPAWRDGSIEAVVFGHALLEHPRPPGQLCVGKALIACVPPEQARKGATNPWRFVDGLAAAIRTRGLLADPQELRPLPLSGIPGWHDDSADAAF